MKSLDSNKAADIFHISPAILRDLTDTRAPLLTILFNKAVSENTYPDTLKITKVIEIYKSGDTTSPSNYRPISLLPIIAKIFDSLINTQIMTHLLKHNLISPTQYAFRPHSNTTTALQSIINNIFKHKHQRHPILAIYIDLSKAYDTVSHDKLLDKLKHNFNFAADTVAFVASYFHNRRQTTHTQHAESQPQTITHGIPQGSTLSTTFFLLYINDITQTVPSSTVYTYADDTTLIISASTAHALETLANSELANLVTYFYQSNLVPNTKKTVFTSFHPRNQIYDIKINDKNLEQTSNAKLLGVIMQDDLKYHSTITNIIKKLQPITQSLRYANKLLPTRTLLNLYYTHVYPHLIGAITIWGTHDQQKTYIQPLIRMQKKIIRLINNKPPRTHTKPLFAEMKLLNITNLYTLTACLEMHPHIYTRSQVNRPEHTHHYLHSAQIHEYPTRYSQNQHHYIPNSNTHRDSKTRTPVHTVDKLTAQYSAIWNTIALSIRQLQHPSQFKLSLKEHLLLRQDLFP